MEVAPIRIKVKLQAEVRRFVVAREGLTFTRLQSEIRKIFNLLPSRVLRLEKLRNADGEFTKKNFQESLKKNYVQIALNVTLSSESKSKSGLKEEQKSVCIDEFPECYQREFVPGPQSRLIDEGKLPEIIRFKDQKHDQNETDWTVVKSETPKSIVIPKSYSSKSVDGIVIYVDGERMEIDVSEAPADELLGNFLRTHNHTSPKIGCGEGGCGCCTVVLSYPDPVTAEIVHQSTNSCMRLLYSCDGMEITTATGIGNQRTAFHPIQETLAAENGTQCGYCTPGWITQMYTLLCNNPNPTVQEIEDNFPGNLCRCTGYRPIMTAFHKFSADSKKKPRGFATRMEAEAKKLMSEGLKHHKQLPLAIRSGDITFLRPLILDDLFDILAENPGIPTRIVVGNTSKGVVKYFPRIASDDPELYIDVSRISELRTREVTSSGIVVGSSVKIAELQQLISTNQHLSPSFEQLVKHISWIAGQQVRNSGTWAGNMMIGQTHPTFPSDILTIMAAANAVLTLAHGDEIETEISIEEFVARGVPTGSIIKEMFIPFASAEAKFFSWKIRSRDQNAHPIINAAFQFEISPNLAIRSVNMVYGGIVPLPFFARQTMNFLIGQPLNEETLRQALSSLSQEIQPSGNPLHSVNYRRSLAVNLFYKAFLMLLPSVHPRLESTAEVYQRDISRGCQVLTSPGENPPIADPITLLSGELQTSGETMYTSDNPNPQNGVYAAPVTTTVAKGTIVAIDCSSALLVDGVTDFISARDVEEIGGNNNLNARTEVFISSTVPHYGAVIGMIIAKTQAAAEMAAEMVEVTYDEPTSPPIFSIQEAIDQGDVSNPSTLSRGDVEQGLASADHVIEGEVLHNSQFSFPLETHSCNAFPAENNSIHMVTATQGPAGIRDSLVNVLGMPANRIVSENKRCGGGFGCKASSATRYAAAVAVCCRKLNRPVRSQMERSKHMHAVTRRHPFFNKYRVGYNNDGKIVALDMETYADGGANGGGGGGFQNSVDNVYFIPNYRSVVRSVSTNLPSNAPVRAPDTPNAMLAIENIIDHVARHSGIDQAVVREQNFYGDEDTTPGGNPMPNSTLQEVWAMTKESGQYQELVENVEAFNAANRFRKRGVSIVPIKFRLGLTNRNATCTINIASTDGSVTVSSSGTEIGQGLYTKVAQAVAFGLNIPMDIIHVQETTTRVIPNSGSTVGSSTSESCVQAALDSCDIMNEKLDPFRRPNQTWQQLVSAAGNQNALIADGWFRGQNTPEYVYYIWTAGTCLAEVDLLTGEQTILRADIVYDCGKPLNPAIDLGQVEGSWVMGLGLALTELVLVEENGSLRTPGTWDYKIPCSKSIPVEFNVSFLDKAQPFGIQSSKASGEPAVDLCAAPWLAVKNAIIAGRKELGLSDNVEVKVPLTVERTANAIPIDIEELTL